jgi:hypothetical protein
MELESIRKGSLSSLVKENLKLFFARNGLKAGDPIPDELWTSTISGTSWTRCAAVSRPISSGPPRGRHVAMRIPFDAWDFPAGWAYIAVPAWAIFMIAVSVNDILQPFPMKEGTK